MSTPAVIVREERSVRVVNFVLPSVSILLTIFRLYERASNHRLWWDDAWAALTMVFSIAFMVIVELFVRYHVVNPDKYPQGAKIAVYYMCDQFFYLVAWCAKVSILFTIIRLAVIGPLRRFCILTAILFGVTWAVLFAQVWWVCESEPGWKQTPAPQCDLGQNVAIAQVICDVFSDAILIAAPIHLVWKVRLSRPQKIRIIAIFSSTMLTTAVSLNHASWVLRDGELLEALAAVIQTSVSLIVVNLSVLVAYAFRISTDASDDRPEPLEIKSIVTFGKGSSRRKRVEINALTTTLITTEGDMQTTAIQLDTFASEGGDEDKGDIISSEIDLTAPKDNSV